MHLFLSINPYLASVIIMIWSLGHWARNVSIIQYSFPEENIKTCITFLCSISINFLGVFIASNSHNKNTLYNNDKYARLLLVKLTLCYPSTSNKQYYCNDFYPQHLNSSYIGHFGICLELRVGDPLVWIENSGTPCCLSLQKKQSLTLLCHNLNKYYKLHACFNTIVQACFIRIQHYVCELLGTYYYWSTHSLLQATTGAAAI